MSSKRSTSKGTTTFSNNAKICLHCNRSDHCRISNSKCPKHSEWLLRRGKNSKILQSAIARNIEPITDTASTNNGSSTRNNMNCDTAASPSYIVGGTADVQVVRQESAALTCSFLQNNSTNEDAVQLPGTGTDTFLQEEEYDDIDVSVSYDCK